MKGFFSAANLSLAVALLAGVSGQCVYAQPANPKLPHSTDKPKSAIRILAGQAGSESAGKRGTGSARSPDKTEKIVLLHNGNVLIGHVSLQGDRYDVATGGAMLRVQASDVAFIASSLIDAYERSRRQFGRPNIDQHLQLAQWCLRHELWPQAARELLDARGLDPNHPRVGLLERRLAVASAQLANRSSDAPTDSTGASNEYEVDEHESGDQPTDDQQPSVPTTSSPAEESEVTFNELPAGALERFTRRIQPLLVNNCTTTGCHRESGPSEFQLSRALLYGESNRRSTSQNLAATLQQINHHAPQESPLLNVPLKAHGGLDSAVFPPHRKSLYQQLVDWAWLVTGPHEPKSEPPVQGANSAWGSPTARVGPTGNGFAPSARVAAVPAANAYPTAIPPRSRHTAAVPSANQHAPLNSSAAPLLPAARPPLPHSATVPAAYQQSAAVPAGINPSAPSAYGGDGSLGGQPAAWSPQQPPRVQFGAQVKPFQPRDEFDPNIFNRRFAQPDGGESTVDHATMPPSKAQR